MMSSLSNVNVNGVHETMETSINDTDGKKQAPT